ncbi:MAG: undecaprenyl/decaprenyl-phosphate alpha-N-acetylglucosaminyl 1-phosphate transferase, partial [Aeriscardovia sp.]|nr:undecaprenyl/decaprenyl-phosphate alpha-N-acetylglucosaminyl 1-phosphate transferase [Aeriscardovia sp.]
MRAYFFIFLCAFLAVALLTPMVRRLAIKAGAIQQIRKRDVHTVPTPRMGGVAMFLGFALALCFARAIPWFRSLFQGDGYQQWIILLGAFLICLLGVADDLFDLDWM